MWHMGDGWGWWMLFGWIWMAVFWGLIIWGAFTLIRYLSQPRGTSTSGGESALDLLERRYAAGELDHEEFEERRRRILDGRSREPSGWSPASQSGPDTTIEQ
jgi:putative membrane protein